MKKQSTKIVSDFLINNEFTMYKLGKAGPDEILQTIITAADYLGVEYEEINMGKVAGAVVEALVNGE